MSEKTLSPLRKGKCFFLTSPFIEPHFFGFQPPKKFMGSLPPSQELRGRVLRGCIHRPEDLSDKRSDNLHENERRSQLSILKSPPKQPKAVTIQARVEESVKAQLGSMLSSSMLRRLT